MADFMEIAPGTSIRDLCVLRPEDTSDSAVMPEAWNYVLREGASLNLTVLVLPGAGCKLPFNIDLDGEGASVNISGLYLCSGADKLDISVLLRHNVPHCFSRQLFKGVASGNSRVYFDGRIVVAKDAQQTEAYQENHSFLLSPDAKVETLPQLEIYADDVKCSHGATVGSLNEEEQFYMRSRGISLEEARVLQVISFLSPVLDTLEDEEQRLQCRQMVESELKKLF